MWLGVGAGLPLLTWILARPVYAGNVSFNDQQLSYEGRGWQVAAAPQACSSVSPTVHTTSDTGDFVTFNFTGNGVSVRGPLTTLSTPVTILVDGNIKQVAPPVLGSDGCGILFTDANVDGSQEHVLTMVFAAASGSVPYSVSGLTVNTLDAVPVANDPQTPSALPPSITPSPSSVNGTSTSNPTPITASSSVSSAAVLGMSSAAANNSSPPSSDSASSSNGSQSTAFATAPGTIVGAIVGAIMAMLGLLVFFVLLRRRITRRNARKLDQENSIGRWGRDFDDSKGKFQEEPGLAPVWDSKAGELPQSALETTPREKASLIMNVPTTSVPEPAASVERTQPHQVVNIAQQSTASAYSVPLEAALRRRSSVSDSGSGKQSLSDFPPVPVSSRPTPPPISVPPIPPTLPTMSSTPFSNTMPRLATATALDPTSAYSAAATLGDGVGQDGHGLRVINWSGTIDTPAPSSKRQLPPLPIPQPPPGFI